MNKKHLPLILLILVLFGTGAGCQANKPLPMQEVFARIVVGRSDASEVLNLLGEKGLLHTAESVSVINQHGWSRELGIVQFNTEDSLVRRKDYVQVRSGMLVPMLSQERIYLQVQTMVPQEVLDEPYENDTQKHIAILEHCRKALVSDAKPFEQDQKTMSIVGLARSALREAILQLTDRPREADKLLTDQGFDFTHTVMGKSYVRLVQEQENIFTLHLAGSDTVDMFNTW